MERSGIRGSPGHPRIPLRSIQATILARDVHCDGSQIYDPYGSGKVGIAGKARSSTGKIPG
jgi:hypothetical protein